MSGIRRLFRIEVLSSAKGSFECSEITLPFLALPKSHLEISVRDVKGLLWRTIATPSRQRRKCFTDRCKLTVPSLPDRSHLHRKNIKMLSIAAISTMALSCLAASASAAVLYAGGSPTWWSEFRPRVTGINESGGEFSPSNIPGTFGVDYEFLDQVSETRLIIMLIPLVKDHCVAV